MGSSGFGLEAAEGSRDEESLSTTDLGREFADWLLDAMDYAMRQKEEAVSSRCFGGGNLFRFMVRRAGWDNRCEEDTVGGALFSFRSDGYSAFTCVMTVHNMPST